MTSLHHFFHRYDHQHHTATPPADWPQLKECVIMSELSRWVRTCLGAGAVFLLTMTPAAAAQDSRSISPLTIPTESAMVCRAVTEGLEESGLAGGSAFTFVTKPSPESERMIYVTFDSTAHAKALTSMVATWSEAGDLVMLGVGVRFELGRVIAGFHLREQDALAWSVPQSGGVDTTFKQLSALTEAEEHEALALAAWLWAHRCGRDVSQPSRNTEA